jgi:hypothetical protein
MTIFALLLYPVFLFLLTVGGNFACRVALTRSGVRPKPLTKDASSRPGDTLQAGRMIGSIERILIMIGLVARSWEVLVAVIALKTVARYKELDEQIEAEYFLIGSLVSILWAVLVTLAAISMDKSFGFDLSTALNEAIAASD